MKETLGNVAVEKVRKWPGDESGACLARLKMGREKKGEDEGEGKIFSPRLVTSARIRGRQAIVDVFMRMERQRYRELESLQSKHVVTKFPQRGRIQVLYIGSIFWLVVLKTNSTERLIQ